MKPLAEGSDSDWVTAQREHALKIICSRRACDGIGKIHLKSWTSLLWLL